MELTKQQYSRRYKQPEKFSSRSWRETDFQIEPDIQFTHISVVASLSLSI